MTEQLEHELRQLFVEDAEQAPAVVALAEEARRRVRRHRHARLAWGTGLLVAASVAGVAAFGSGLLTGSPVGERPAAPSAASFPNGLPTGPVWGGGTASCVMGYSPGNMAGLAFAFDGTVTSIGPGQSDRSGSNLGLVGTTFTVNEWFVGGSGTTVTVDMPPPGDRDAMDEVPPAYEVGSRLLVSGQHRWGGATMDDAIAWGCGFTRYYDKATAHGWRAATH
jgi:hypothetical protein